MTDHLRLTLTPDDDGTAELHAEVVANGFSGRGSAWFNVSAVADLAGVLCKAFPLSDPVELEGGYWIKESGAGLTQEHLALRFYPVAGRGVLGSAWLHRCKSTTVQEFNGEDQTRDCCVPHGCGGRRFRQRGSSGAYYGLARRGRHRPL